MHAQVVRIQLQPGKVDEALGVFRDSILPAVKQRPGLQDAYVLLDRENNRAIALGLYASKEDVDALVSSGFFQEQAGKLADKLAGPPEREVYEVVGEA